MNWEMVSAVCAIVFACLSLLNSWMTNNIRAEISKLKLHIAEVRAEDREEIREWINGSFLRAKEAVGRMDLLEKRVDRIEDRPSIH